MTNHKQKPKLYPEIRVHWKRFPKNSSANLKVAFKKPQAFLTVGSKDSGKSAWDEAGASNYVKIIDLYGSRDNEGLSWLRSPFKDHVLLLKGDSVTIDCNCADVRNASEVSMKEFENYQVIVSAASFYSTMNEEWKCMAKLLQKFWRRESYTDPWAVIIREAASLVASRHILASDQTTAINYVVQVVREMRHSGFALFLDTLRWYGMDRDIRAVADYIIIKATGTEGLPDDLHFLYRYFNPFHIQQMKAHKFIILSTKGSIGVGTFDLPSWHKIERENMRSLFNIQVDYKDTPMTSDNARNVQVSEYEHVRIIKARMELPENERAMGKLGAKLKRSSKTIQDHLRYHSSHVESMGECDKCARIKGAYAKRVVD